MAEMAGEIGAFGAGAAAGAAVGGFAGAKEALGAAGVQTSQLKEQMSSGALRIDPQVARDAGKFCREQAEQVHGVLDRYRQIASLEGLGDYDTSTELTHHFVEKAKNDEGGALTLLRDLGKEMVEQAKLFEEAAKDYESRDEQISGDLGKGVQ